MHRTPALAVVVLAASAFGQPAAYIEPAEWLQALGVSRDGRFVVGRTAALAVMYDLQTSSETVLGAGRATGISADGGVVVGLDAEQHVFRWTPAGGLTTITTDAADYDPAISADGGTIVGVAAGVPFRWTLAGGHEALVTPAGAIAGAAYSVSGDGAAIVGVASMGQFSALPVLWSGLFPTIVGPTSPAPDAALSIINADGSIAFGVHVDYRGADAFRWTAAGGLEDLGFPALGTGVPVPTAATPDGAIVAGGVVPPGAFVWSAGTGIRVLDSVLTGSFGVPLAGRQLSLVGGISADGRVLAGTAIRPIDGTLVGWIAILPTPVLGGCYANCDGSTAAPILNVNDFICFEARFAAGDPYANCDGSTFPPVLNVNDFICFENRMVRGCQ
jgi:hypothetical protein